MNFVRKIFSWINAAIFNVLNTILSTIYRRLPPNKNIFLLGHDRSGTSWISSILGQAENAIYVYEPINEDVSKIGDFNLYNTHLAPEETSKEHEEIFDLAVTGFGPKTLNLKQMKLKVFSDPTIIIKEVGGMMLGEWFENRYAGKIALIFRHPAPVVLSNIKMGTPNADSWLQQLKKNKFIYDKYFHLIDFHKIDKQDVVTKFSVIYCIRNSMALSMLERNPHWIYLKYEDFCLDPRKEFNKLFKSVDLTISDSNLDSILQTSTIDKSEHFFGTSRKSKSMLTKWHQECSMDDEIKIRRVMKLFDFPLYCSSADWLRD